MTTRRPWFPFYQDDFEASGRVRLMSNAERGCYVTLLAFQWREGWVPSEVVELARLCNEPPATMRKYWRRLESCFPVGEDGKRRNPRLEEERRKAEAVTARQSAKGRLRQSRGTPPATVPAEVGLASGRGSGSDLAAFAVSSTQITGHTPQEATTSVLRTGAAPRSEAQPWDNHGAASHLKAICYAPDGTPPEGVDIAEDLRFWKRCLRAGQPEGRILAALHGLPHVMHTGGKWSPARVFGKRGDWVSLFERAVTEDGKHGRPSHLAAELQRLSTPPMAKGATA